MDKFVPGGKAQPKAGLESKDSHGSHDFLNIWTDKRKIFKNFT